MTSEQKVRVQEARPHGALVHCALFSLAMLVAYVVVASGAAMWNAPNRWLVAAVAAGVCWLTGVAALGVAAVLRGPEMAVLNMLIGLLVRMFVPLGALTIIYARGGVLVNAGLAYYVLIFYMVSLAIETRYLVLRSQGFAG